MTKVSIITPSYNSKYISNMIQSVLDQTFSDWELIIVDDASTDNTVSVILSFINIDSRIKLIQLDSNHGAAFARNSAIQAAVGRYIAFLDSDDIWLPNKLELQLEFMEAHNVSFSYSAYEKVSESGLQLGSVGVPDKVSYNDLLKVCSIGCLTAIYDTYKLDKIYMPNIRKRQDLGLWLRILKIVPFAYATPGSLAKYRVRSDSISANKRVAAVYTWRLYRDVEGLPFFSCVYFFLHYAVNGILRTKFPNIARFLNVLK